MLCGSWDPHFVRDERDSSGCLATESLPAHILIDQCSKAGQVGLIYAPLDSHIRPIDIPAIVGVLFYHPSCAIHYLLEPQASVKGRLWIESAIQFVELDYPGPFISEDTAP